MTSVVWNAVFIPGQNLPHTFQVVFILLTFFHFSVILQHCKRLIKKNFERIEISVIVQNNFFWLCQMILSENDIHHRPPYCPRNLFLLPCFRYYVRCRVEATVWIRLEIKIGQCHSSCSPRKCCYRSPL